MYFTTPVHAKLESDAKQVVEPGSVCFWTQGDALALPFAHPCNVLGAMKDYSALKALKAGQKIRVEKV